MTMRINKYIAAAGIASRRGADELIAAGKVKVNGAVLTEPGRDIGPDDVVEVRGKVIGGLEKPVYYALNKPAGYISSARDEHGRPTVLNLLTDVTARVFPVGRLDYETTGLLLLTNDGELSNRITHPSRKVFKTYRAVINGSLSQEQLWRLRKGVDIGGYVTAPAYAEILEQQGDASLVEIKISEGRNRQVRKMFEAVGFRVLALQRTAVGEIKLGRLKEGTYRKLSPQELEYLRGL